MTESEELKYKRAKVEECEANNQRMYDELKQAAHGRFSMDTSDTRREMFFDYLIEWGVITWDQRIDFELAFQQKVEEALNSAWKQFRESQKPNLKVVQKPAGLLDQNGRPL